jgi:hypothetical protein
MAVAYRDIFSRGVNRSYLYAVDEQLFVTEAADIDAHRET